MAVLLRIYQRHQTLVDDYVGIVNKVLKVDGGKMTQQLAKEMIRENFVNSQDQSPTATLLDVKKEIYRFPSLAVDCLALSSNTVPSTVWQTIEDMKTKEVISAENAHHLKVLVSISAELRLRTYIANGGQKENLSALSAMTASHDKSIYQTSNLQKVLYIPDLKQLFRYYFTANPLKKLFTLDDKFTLLHSTLYDSSAGVKGDLYRLCNNNMDAVKCYEEALQNPVRGPEHAALLFNLGLSLASSGEHRKAIHHYEQALQMFRAIYTARVWHDLGDPRKAIRYRELALQMYRAIYGETAAHPNIALTLAFLAGLWKYLDKNKAVSYAQQALEMTRIRGDDARNVTALALTNLGSVWWDLDEHEKAISCNEETLQILRRIYGESAAHPRIANVLNNLGTDYGKMGHPRKAISYIDQALRMGRKIHGPNSDHVDIAQCLNNLGVQFNELREHQEAVKYLEQALKMYETIFGPRAPHPKIVGTLKNLGFAWRGLGDYSKAVNYYEKALQMYKTVYGETTANKDFASFLCDIGTAYMNLEDYKKALGVLEHSLQVLQTIYGSGTANIYTVVTLKLIGITWRELGDYRKAIEYFEQTLEMEKAIYGDNAARVKNATYLRNLGSAMCSQGDYKQAMKYYEEAVDAESCLQAMTRGGRGKESQMYKC
uniref:Uncharacterized protein n=1 Tax=Branchiostoma floridae TaxID=7739 RepID=C3ZRR3_BRAFL|eukprot:XP_002588852.1 hypothetical protein BRAFLDRAFT_99564 [Branchiostoma floridae]